MGSRVPDIGALRSARKMEAIAESLRKASKQIAAIKKREPLHSHP
jgi:hypothetical protein